MRIPAPVRTALALAFALPFAASAQSAEPATTAPAAPQPAKAIRPDPAAPSRVWDGWGVSLAWWGKVYGDRDDLADAVFSTRTV